MTLWDELYFEITAQGTKADLKKLVNFIKSGELDDFIESASDYIIYDDAYAAADDAENSEIIFTNDDYGMEIDEFDTDEFLEILCKAGKNLDLFGCLYDGDGSEFHFTSEKGDSYYINSRKAVQFNDELDEVAYKEDNMDDEN